MSLVNAHAAENKAALRVLIFEDCKADIELILRTLASGGLEVYADVATTLSELLAYARMAPYDLILSDYTMPQATGIDAFNSLQSEGFDTPFILVSGVLGEEKAVDCLKAGMADYVLKDNLLRLPAAVSRALSMRRLRRQREQAEARIRQLNRLYSVLSRAGQAIVRIRERTALLQETCRILTEAGEFKMAWVGLLEPSSGRVVPAASSPPDMGFLAGLHVTTGDGDAAWGNAGTAIRERRHVVCNQFAADPRMQPVCEQARFFGYQSAGAFPLIAGGAAIGMVAIYAGEPAFFDAENIALLDELAADVSFALERMDAEERQRRATEEMTQFFALSRELLCISGLDGRVVRVNQAWETALGISVAALQGETWIDLVHPDDLAAATTALARLRDGRETEQLELRFRSKSGAYRWLVGSATPAPGRDAIFAALRDLTVRKQLEEELREKNAELLEQNRRVESATRMKSEFLANMSHELRSPLNGIIGFSELLIDSKLGPLAERPREFIGRIHASAMHLLNLINNLLDLSKVEAGRLEFQPAPVIVSEAMIEVIGTLGALAVKNNIRIETEIDPTANRVVADPERLKQILYNYLSNALKFTGQGGRIVARLKAEGERHFRLEVADTGSGIQEQDLGRLFVEFGQLDTGKAKRHPGTGLGLALTKRLVEAQGGTVGVQSEAGRGSTFYAVLPRKPRDGSSLGSLAKILTSDDPKQRSPVST